MKQAKSKKRRVFDAATNVKTVKDKLEKKAGKVKAALDWANQKDNFNWMARGAAKVATTGALAGVIAGKIAKPKMEKKANVYLEKIAKANWISGAIKKPGALHKELGIPEDKKIPKATLDSAAKKGSKLGERARLVETLEGIHKKAEIKMENKYLEKII